jgi:ACS family glucarate transporter-like MFS transporter
VPGLVWAACWAFWFRDYPQEKIVHESTATTPAQSVGAVLRSRAMLLAMAQYFAGNFTFYICISWMHPYLIEHFGLTQRAAARYAMIPLLCGAGSNWVAGLLVDSLYKSGLRAWSRRIPGIAGFVLAATGVLWVSVAGSATSAIIGFAIATFGVEMTISPSWAFCLDIGGTRSGTVSAAMNMAGNFGGFVSTNAFPLLRSLTGSPATYFRAAALLNVAAILCWWSMRSLSTPSPLEIRRADSKP